MPEESVIIQSAKKRGLTFVLSAITSIIGTGFGIVPYVIIYFLAVHLFVDGDFEPAYITRLAIYAAGGFIIKAFLNSLSSYLSHVATYNLLYNLRISISEKMGKLSLGYFNQRSTGEIKKILNEDVEQLEHGFAHIIPDICSSFIVPILTAVVLFIIDWRMAVAVVCTIPLILVVYAVSMISAKDDIAKTQSSLSIMNSVIIQYVQGIQVIKTFAGAGGISKEFEKIIDDYTKHCEAFTKKGLGTTSLLMIVLKMNILVVLPTGLFFFLGGSLSLPLLIFFLLIAFGFNEPFYKLFTSAGAAAYSIALAAKSIKRIMTEPEIIEPQNPVPLSGCEIEFSDVCFSYSQDDDSPQVLNKINFTAEPGSVTALVGVSGSGKSTIARLAARFWDVQDGKIMIGGIDIRDTDLKTLYEKISFVFQDVFLFNDSIYENIRIGKPDATESDILKAAELAGVTEFLSELEDGIMSSAGEGGSRLSGGQRQRVAIARAILKDSPIIILDEATAFIDAENELILKRAIDNLTKDKTLIVIAHRLSTISSADQILVLEEGNIVERGTHKELLTSGSTYPKMWDHFKASREWAIKADSGDDKELNPKQYDQFSSDKAESRFSLMQPAKGILQRIIQLAPERKSGLKRGALFLWFESMFIGAPVIITYLSLSAIINGSLSFDITKVYIALLAGAFIFQYIFALLSNRELFSAQNYGAADIRKRIGEHLKRLPLGFYTGDSSGKLNTLLTVGIGNINTATLIRESYTSLISPAVSVIFLFLIEWRLAIATVILIPIVFLISRKANLIFKKTWHELSDAAIYGNSRMIEYIQGISVVKAFNIDGRKMKSFDEAMVQFRDKCISVDVKNSPFTGLVILAIEAGLIPIMLVGTALYGNGSVTAEIFLLFLFVGLVFYKPVSDLAILGPRRRIMLDTLDKIVNLLNTEPVSRPEIAMLPAGAEIQLNNVSFAYGSTNILNGMTFKIPEKKVTALVGKSGTGKSTITRLLCRFWDVDNGEITIGGVDVRNMDPDFLLSQITTVFQDVFLFNDTIMNNLRMGNENASDEEILEAANLACCDDFIKKLPDGFETILSDGGAPLSGGEKQRLSIARAILKDSPIIILDEATASIDPENEWQLQRAFNAACTGRTVIIIAHKLSGIRTADHIVVIDEGRVCESGTHKELVSTNGLYSSLWRMQSDHKVLGGR